MSNLIIVAIPARDDPIWKISSEKVPHLTLLFLGENTEDVPKLGRILDFVEHAVTVEQHGPVMLDVDERGTLGPDAADVVFFDKNYSIKWLTHFRNQLLQQTDIRSAYESVEQYPEWTPHLTLGYPATPAHDDEIPDHGLNWISFDRIAVWTDDYNGPEFRLRWPDNYGLSEVAMTSVNEQRKALGLDALVKTLEIPVEHHGVKGMKWGVRKQKIGSSRVGRGLKQVAKDIYFETDWAKGGAEHQVTVKAAKNWSEKDLPRLKAQYQGTKAATTKSRLTNPLDKNTIEYRSRSRAAFRDRLNEEVAKLPTNASGTRRYDIEDGGATNANYVWHLKTVQVKRSSGLDHAAMDGDLPEFTVKPTFDEDGFIIGFEQVVSDVAHTAALGAEFIAHHGVKGMHWGIRRRLGTRSTPSPVAPKATSKVPAGAKRKTKLTVEGGQNHPAHPDAIKVAEARAKLKKSGPSSLSNQELREVANRVQLENQVAVLTSHKGKQFVTRQLQNEGQNLARAGVREGIKRSAKKAGVAALA